MIKKLLTVTILFAYLYVINISLVCYAEYHLEYNYIVKNLCVQKDKITNTCCGKCFLKKNLDNTSGKSQKSGPTFSDNTLTLHLVSGSISFNNLFVNFQRYRNTSNKIRTDIVLLPEEHPPQTIPFYII